MSALIVSLLLAGIFAVYASAKNITTLALHKAIALAWASSKIEGEKNGMQDAYIDPADDNKLANEDGTQLGGYDRQAVAAVTPTNYGNAMIRRSATVRWRE